VDLPHCPLVSLLLLKVEKTERKYYLFSVYNALALLYPSEQEDAATGMLETEGTVPRKILRSQKKGKRVPVFAHGLDRKHMEAAVSEMLQSQSEHPDKPDPLVGAVLVDKCGKELGRAHRAHFRHGEHSEFSLLEKVAPGWDPRTGTLYVTLEPCTDREPPKRPCAHRIVERGVARVVIGIPDPNPTIHQQGIQYLLRHGVKVDFFDPDLAEQIREHNIQFIKYFESGIGQSFKKPAAFKGASLDETKPVPHTTTEDLSKDAIRRYLRARGLNHRIPSNELWKFFKKAMFLREGPTRRAVPTLAGIVLFGKNPDHFQSDCKVKAACFSGTPGEHDLIENLIEQRDISGPLRKLLDQCESFFLKYVAKVPSIEGSTRVYRPEYPWRVVREALVNALVHRDYQPGAHTYFEMYRDRIVVRSSGHLVPPLTLDMLRAYERVSLKRNPRITDAAYHLGLMEEWGRGIASMPVFLKEHGLREPDFDHNGPFFVVTLYGRALTPVRIRMRPRILQQLTERQALLLDVIESQGRATSEEWTAMQNISRETASQDFKKMIELRLIERKGKGRSTYYVLAAPES